MYLRIFAATLVLFTLGCSPKVTKKKLPARSKIETIDIDGVFDDWKGIQTTTDPKGDATGKFDIVDAAAAIDGDQLYVTFELDGGDGYTLQNGVDSDGALQLLVFSGTKKLTVDFRDRKFFTNDQVLTWEKVDFRCLPTYASNRYELRLTLIDMDSNDLKIDFAGSDSLDEPMSVTDTITESRQPQTFVASKPNDVFRVANLNTLHGGLGNEERGPAQHRLLAHVDADVYAFQEEWKEPEFDAAIPKLSEALGVSVNTLWYGGCALVSRHPIEQVPMTLDRAVAGLLTLDNNQHIVVISVHFKSRGYLGSSEDSKRIQQAEQIVGELKKMRNGDFGDAAKNANVVVVGDYNLVGSGIPLQKFVDTGLQELVCKNPATGEAATWRDPKVGSFWPGRLDLLCYSGKLNPTQAVVFNSSTLPSEQLGNLQKEDSLASDHLMLIGDFKIEM